MKNFEYYSEYIAEAIHDCKKGDDTDCDFCKQKEMCDQLYSVEQIKKWFFEEYKPKLTNDEKAILKNLPKKYKWIARNESLNLYVFKEKPSKSISAWLSSSVNVDDLSLFNHLFQFIKFEDKEPYSIEELLKEN